MHSSEIQAIHGGHQNVMHAVVVCLIIATDDDADAIGTQGPLVTEGLSREDT